MAPKASPAIPDECPHEERIIRSTPERNANKVRMFARAQRSQKSWIIWHLHQWRIFIYVQNLHSGHCIISDRYAGVQIDE